jgi:hypothetical protein
MAAARLAKKAAMPDLQCKWALQEMASTYKTPALPTPSPYRRHDQSKPVAVTHKPVARHACMPVCSCLMTHCGRQRSNESLSHCPVKAASESNTQPLSSSLTESPHTDTAALFEQRHTQQRQPHPSSACHARHMLHPSAHHNVRWTRTLGYEGCMQDWIPGRLSTRHEETGKTRGP